MLDPEPYWSEKKKRADSAAKSALHLIPDKFKIPKFRIPQISKFFHAKWQQRWNKNIQNKLFQIQPTLGEWGPAFRKSRREQVTISRLCIGHTRLTHCRCLTCQMPCTVKPVPIKCKGFDLIRKRFFKVNRLSDPFENV